MPPKKRIKILTSEESIINNEIFDWSKCCLCQDGNLDLVNPSLNKASQTKNDGYRSLANNLQEFHSLNALPINVKFHALDEGQGLEQTLILRKAKWHKSCYLKFATSKLDRLKAQIVNNSDSNIISSSRTSTSRVISSEQICFLCQNPNNKENCHQVCSQDFVDNISKYAEKLNKFDLLGILNTSDLIATKTKYHKSCYTKLFNEYNLFVNKKENETQHLDEKAFLPLKQFITNILINDKNYIFAMSTLNKIYIDELNKINNSCNETINTNTFS